MIEKSAKGVRGFLLYSPFLKENYFFRIYDSKNKRRFKDYKICAEDIHIEILDNHVSLYEDSKKKKLYLEWSSEMLGKKKTK